ncbi:MAG: T9SS type A sorting domain-containing protein [Bacteroidia bacterium]
MLIKIKNINGRGNDLYLDDINLLDVPVGINSTVKPTAGLYPNPNNGTFTFSLQNAKAGTELRIYDVFGKLIYQSTPVNGTSQIDLTNAAAGVYFYRVVSDGQVTGSGILE